MQDAYKTYLKGILPHVKEEDITQEIFDEYEQVFKETQTVSLGTPLDKRHIQGNYQ